MRELYGPLGRLYEAFTTVMARNPALVSRFRLACDALNLGYADGLAMAWHSRFEGSSSLESTYSPIAPFVDEEVFVMCRDVCTNDYLVSRLEHGVSDRELEAGLVYAVQRLGV